MLRVRSRLWLPFTQMQSFDAARRTFVEAHGTTLVDARGARLFDAVSSIWTIVHGHCHPHIVEAISRQAARLDHVTALGATNPVAEELASQLCSESGMDYAFFASDGASAVECAIKMALQFWRQRGEPNRARFVRLVDAYHGDTTGAMSVSDIPVFKERFNAVTFESLPYDSDLLGFDDDVAAVIVEPLVQAAAGMRIVPPETYRNLRHIRPLVIVDEIATGFGRTGSMFAFTQLGLKPDMICLGKGITGGTLALSATLTTERIYEAFLCAFNERRHLFHGHSYAANPIACAAALASLELFALEGTLANADAIARRARLHCERLRSRPGVRDVRQAGCMIGIELDPQAIDLADAPGAGRRIANDLYERGQFTRPIGDVVQFVPPLSSTISDVDAFFEALSDSLA
jgi:adenosylmethionine-8-amino-7-oxononanoate aminotransferase